jgi:polysaccharide export outer membrane protein
MRKIPVRAIGLALSAQTLLYAQAAQQPPARGVQTPPGIQTPPPVTNAVERLRPNYILRAGDQILIRAFEMEEISERPFRIDGDGFINLPQLGRVKAAGVTVERMEATLIE